MQGVLRKKKIRQSLDVTSWEAAQRIAREMEIHGEAVSAKDACGRWLADCEARHLKPESMRLYKRVAEQLKRTWAERPIRAISTDDIRALREEWKLSALTTRKRLELVRGFLNFCVASGWLQTNPAKAIKPPVVKPNPTLPFTEEEWTNILTAVDVVREIHPQIPESTQRKLKAIILLMRYSGIRISDAVSLKRDRIKHGKLFLYTAKTGKPVHVPLPEETLAALKAAAGDGDPYYFWSGTGKLKTALTEWQERLKKIGSLAGTAGRGFAHRLRDTFSVSLLEKGVPLETVAALLGNTVKVCEKHYAPWIESRQVALEAAVKETWA